MRDLLHFALAATWFAALGVVFSWLGLTDDGSGMRLAAIGAIVGGAIAAAGSVAGSAMSSSAAKKAADPMKQIMVSSDPTADPLLNAVSILGLQGVGDVDRMESVLRESSPMQQAINRIQESTVLDQGTKASIIQGLTREAERGGTGVAAPASTKTQNRLEAIRALQQAGSLPMFDTDLPDREVPAEGFNQWEVSVLKKAGIDRMDLMRRQAAWEQALPDRLQELKTRAGDNAELLAATQRGLLQAGADFPVATQERQGELASMRMATLLRQIDTASDDETRRILEQANFGRFNPGAQLADVSETRLNQIQDADILSIMQAGEILSGRQVLAGNEIAGRTSAISGALNPLQSTAALRVGQGNTALNTAAMQANSINQIRAAGLMDAGASLGTGIGAAGAGIGGAIQNFQLMQALQSRPGVSQTPTFQPVDRTMTLPALNWQGPIG